MTFVDGTQRLRPDGLRSARNPRRPASWRFLSKRPKLESTSRNGVMKSSRLAATVAAIVVIFGGVSGCGQRTDDTAKKAAAVQPAPASAPQAAPKKPDYMRAVYSPLHFRPASETATNEQCIECHQEVLTDKLRAIFARGPQGRLGQGLVSATRHLHRRAGNLSSPSPGDAVGQEPDEAPVQYLSRRPQTRGRRRPYRRPRTMLATRCASRSIPKRPA